MKKVAVIGGGTGTYTVLSGLKKYPLHLTAIISMMDSGGSNRILRDEFGLLPTSDIRQCIVALADEEQNEDLRKLFNYRYESGIGISGMTFGNLFMAAMTDVYGSQEDAIQKTCKLLNVHGDIFPVTYDDSHLVALYNNGRQILGEHYIDMPDDEVGRHKIAELSIIPEARANKKALQAIKNADYIILGPGDLYTSTICNLVVSGVANAITDSKAKVIYVMNLMTKFGETFEYKASNHIKDLEKYLKKGRIDICIVNSSKDLPKDAINVYKSVNSNPVVDDLVETRKFKVVRKDLTTNKVYQKSKSDKVHRSLIRHDAHKLAEVIYSLMELN